MPLSDEFIAEIANERAGTQDVVVVDGVVIIYDGQDVMPDWLQTVLAVRDESGNTNDIKTAELLAGSDPL